MRTLRWSMVGVGIAGRARARAISESDRDQLVKVWRGRFAADLGCPIAESFADALVGVDAVAVCSPTEHHGAQVRAALEAGRHVVVEFPVARNEAEAAGLFALAREQGVTLHVEHIELLESAGRTLASQTRPELIERLVVNFERSGPQDAGAPALALGNVARLHRLCALAGDVEAIEAATVDAGSLAATLRMACGISASVQWTQAPYLKRRTHIELDTPSDKWVQTNSELQRNGRSVSLLGTRSLFAADQRVATARILDGSKPYLDDARILHVLRVCDRLASGTLGAV